ncbi:kinase [Mesorhizobium sp. CCNWLW179-1]|uniref:GHMP family kinase ATP-binding protein n=1 Tax=unclassified Mesorhizobium TaxID=325217 RepID=UPI003014376A
MVETGNLVGILVTRRPAFGTGKAHAIAHHGELLQGVFEDDAGRLHRGLMTLPLDRIRSVATFKITETARIKALPPDRTKAETAARLTLEHIDRSHTGGDLVIKSAIPVGHGYGSSTADVVSSIRAVADAHDVKLRRSSICRLAVAAEGASDAIPYEDQAVLFAHREGVVIEHFGGALPPLLVVGFKAHNGMPIDTLGLQPARYGSEEIQLFRILRGLASRSIRFQDPYLLGRVATVSAQISQRHLPKSRLDVALQIARQHHACGVQVAHSGSLVGVLLDAAQRDAWTKALDLAQTIRDAGFKDVEIHSVNTEEALENET